MSKYTPSDADARIDAARSARFGEMVSTRTELMLAVLRHLPGVLDEHAAMRGRLFELEELCVGDDPEKPDEPLRWRGSGEPVAEGWE